MHHIIYIMTMTWVLHHCLFNCTFRQHATNCMGKSIHPNAV